MNRHGAVVLVARVRGVSEIFFLPTSSSFRFCVGLSGEREVSADSTE